MSKFNTKMEARRARVQQSKTKKQKEKVEGKKSANLEKILCSQIKLTARKSKCVCVSVYLRSRRERGAK